MESKEKRPRVIMCRHGSTNLNNKDKSVDRIRGWLDVPLNDEGLEDAMRDRDKFKDLEYDVIYSSDLKRAIQTSIIINDLHKKDIYKSSSLRPWNLGVYEGQITNKVLPILQYYEEKDNLIPKDGESFKNFRLRLLSFVDEVIRLAKEQNLVILLASHFRDLQTVNAWVQKGKPTDYTVDLDTMKQDKFKPGDIYEIPLE